MKGIFALFSIGLALAANAASLSDLTTGGSSNLDWPTEAYAAGMDAWEKANAPAAATVSAGIFFSTCWSVPSAVDAFVTPSVWTLDGPSADVKTRFGLVLIFR